MKLSFVDIVNKEHGKTAVVVGLGKSAMPDIKKINSLYGKDGFVIISCNDFDMMTDLKVNYWVHANSVDTIGKNYHRYNAHKATIIYADTVDRTPKEFVEKNLTVDYLPYDQRHFGGYKCRQIAPCCENMIPERLTIQEELKRYCHYDLTYSTADTVAIHMTALAVLLGCKKIFITGVDLDYTNGYVNGGNIPKAMVPHLNQYLDRILADFAIIKLSAQIIGTEIFIKNTNTHLKDIFAVKSIDV